MPAVKGMEGLKQAWGESFVPPPDLPEITSFTVDETVAERLREGAAKVREWVVSALTQIGAINAASREVQELNEDRLLEAKTAISGFLHDKTKAYRRAAWLAKFQYGLAKSVSSRSEAEAVIGDLVEQSLLLVNPEGSLKAYDKAYSVPTDSTFKEPEIEEVSNLLRELVGRARQADFEAKRQASESLYSRTELSLEDFLAGKPGCITLGIPPEQQFWTDGKPKTYVGTDGETHLSWRGGGTLLVKNDGDRVVPVGASGTIQRAVDEAIRLNVHLLRYTLDWAYPLKVANLEIEEEKKKKIILLWNLLKRGIAAAKQEAETRAEKARLAGSTATITQKEFFLEGEIGVCLVELDGPWESKVREGEPSTYIFPCYFLAERFHQGEGEEDQQTFLRVVGVPTNLEEYLAGCREDYPEGDKYSGCPWLLKGMLQAAFGQAQKEQNMAVKYGRNGSNGK